MVIDYIDGSDLVGNVIPEVGRRVQLDEGVVTIVCGLEDAPNLCAAKFDDPWNGSFILIPRGWVISKGLQ